MSLIEVDKWMKKKKSFVVNGTGMILLSDSISTILCIVVSLKGKIFLLFCSFPIQIHT